MTVDTPSSDDPRSTRLAHVRAESAVTSLGQLCYLVAGLSLLGTVEFLLVAVGVLIPPEVLKSAATPGQIRVSFGVLAGFLAINAMGQWALGFGLGRLKRWARWTVVALTGLSLVSHVGTCVAVGLAYPLWGLVALAIGGAIHAVILYPLLTPGAGVVFSDHYRDVIRATPEIRGRMHWLLKLGLGLIGVGVLGLLGYLAGLYLRIID